MNRKLTLLILPFFLFFVFATGFAQQSTLDTARRSPRSQKPGSYLIVWTQTQAPEPAPQPSGRQTTTPDPKPETQTPPPASQPEGSQAQGQAQQAQPAAQSFTGTISKEGDSYVLKVSDTSSYKLDDQDKAKEFEGKRVAVFGTLDPNTNLIRVQKIEPVS
jgi:LAS superfamily LD-carboxypeptidase LdcB